MKRTAKKKSFRGWMCKCISMRMRSLLFVCYLFWLFSVPASFEALRHFTANVVAVVVAAFRYYLVRQRKWANYIIVSCRKQLVQMIRPILDK